MDKSSKGRTKDLLSCGNQPVDTFIFYNIFSNCDGAAQIIIKAQNR
jgi:hypothetical protein